MTESELQESASKFYYQILLGMVWRRFDATVSVPNYCQACWSKKLLLGHIINILSLFRSSSTGEYSILIFCIGPPYSRANTASLEPNILLYCPPTRAIYRITSNLTDVSNFSDSCLYYFLTSNYIVQLVHLNISCSNYTDSTQSYHT